MQTNENYSLYKSAKLIWNVLFVISFSTIIVTIAFNRQRDLVSNLFCLPLVFCLSLMLTRRLFFRQPGLALIILETTIFIRFVFIPLMYSFSSQYTGVIVPGANFFKAVWLMVYEEIIVSLAMFFWSFTRNRYSMESFSLMNVKKLVRPFTIMLICFWLFIIAVNSKLRGTLFNFKLLTAEQMGFSAGYSKAEFNADIPGFFSVFFEIGLVVLMATLVIGISKVKWNSFLKGGSILLISIGFVSSMWTNGFSVSRWGMLIGTIMSVYVLVYAFPHRKKAIVTCGLVAIIGVVIVGSALKVVSIKYSSSGTIADAFSKYLNAEMFDEYFQGIAPVANGIRTAEIYGEARGLEGIFLDTCYNFPYAMRILGLSGQPVATSYFHATTGHYDLIMPTITEGYMQFGVIFAPLYSVVLVLLVLWIDRKREATPSFYKKLFYTELVFWLSLFMAVSTNVIEANIWPSVIAIWIFTIEEKYTFTIGPIGTR